MGTRAFAAALALATVAAPAPAQTPDLAALHAPLEALALELARGGAWHEALEVAQALAALDREPEAVARLRTALQDADRRQRRVEPARLAQTVRRVLRGLGPALATLPPAVAQQAARALLPLDDGLREAHLALGHVEQAGRFTDPASAAPAARRAALQTALARARSLAVPVTLGASTDDLLARITGQQGVLAANGRLNLHTAWPEPKAQRVVQNFLRADALARWLLGGELAVGKVAETVVHLGSRDRYRRALAELQGRRPRAPDEYELDLQLSGSEWDHTFVSGDPLESHLAASLLTRQHMVGQAPLLAAGYVHWVCMEMLGTGLPYFVPAGRAAAPAAGTSASSAAEAAEREERRLLARAGVAGCRAWLAFLARRREDPPWTRPPRDHIGRIQGDDLAKCALMAEYLYEQELLAPVTKATAGLPPDTEAFTRGLEQALGRPLARLEEDWRRWLLADEGDLVTRLEARGTPPTADERATLEHLNKARARALTIPKGATERAAVAIEPSRSAACAAHAEYLARNPQQLGAWPDAHEELPDREGFTADGAWAGQHSVIANEVRSLPHALDVWLGTFYHRLPLLEPGLLRIGVALRGGIAVLDAGSLCVPIEQCMGHAVWPPPGATAVPTRFTPELPNPVPGADQGQLGYPVTLQLGQGVAGRSDDVTLALRTGGERGPPVECWVITPAAPMNHELAPRHAFALIPKAPLQKATSYTVIAQAPQLGRLVWSFTTQ